MTYTFNNVKINGTKLLNNAKKQLPRSVVKSSVFVCEYDGEINVRSKTYWGFEYEVSFETNDGNTHWLYVWYKL